MENEKRNQIILIGSIIFLLLSVLLISIMLSYSSKNKESSSKVAIKQIYSSDYDLHYLGDSYFFGTYDNKINVIINEEGKEVFKSDYEISYTDIYKVENGYLIVNLVNNRLDCYLFDGKIIQFKYSLENVENLKPIFFNETLIAFVAVKENNFVLYSLDNGSSISLPYDFVGDVYKDNIYINFTKDFFIVKDKDGNMGVIDRNGNLLIDFIYKNLIGTENNSFIAVNKKNKYGLLSLDGTVLLDFHYNGIASISDYYLLINAKNKMALYASNLQESSGFVMEYNTIVPYNLRSSNNSIQFFQDKNKVFLVNNNLETQIPYTSHYLYVIENFQIINKLEQDEVYATKPPIYKKNNLYYVYGNQNEIISLEKEDKILNVESFEDTMKITYFHNNKEEIKYYSLFTKSFLNQDGEILKSTSFYHAFLDKEKKTISITDKYDKEITSLSGNKIAIHNNYIILDYAIYQIIEKN